MVKYDEMVEFHMAEIICEYVCVYVAVCLWFQK